MVNNVSGFIGPEILYDGKQMIRANLEDLCMGKLAELPMGMAPCYTTHAEIDQNDHEIATMLLALGGSAYFMGIAQNDDVMLSYQDTSFHDDAALRRMLGLRPNRSSSGGWSRSACSRVASRRAGSETRVSSTDDEDFLTALRRRRPHASASAVPDCATRRARSSASRKIWRSRAMRCAAKCRKTWCSDFSSRSARAPSRRQYFANLARSLPR